MSDEILGNSGDIDIGRVEYLIGQELQNFVSSFGGHPVSEAQEMRAFLIAWLAVFLPEVFHQDLAHTLVDRLIDTVSGLHTRDDYRAHGWYEVLPLDMASFALTNDYYRWLRSAVQNVNHANSSLREIVVYSLALVADRIDFHDPELHQRIAYNLESQQMYCDECLLILAVARGRPEAKHELFKDWQSRYGAHPFGGSVLAKLLKGELVGNPFFLAHFLHINQYVNLRLAMGVSKAKIDAINSQRILQGRLPIDDSAEPLALRMWHRLRSHPLMASHITLTGEAQP